MTTKRKIIICKICKKEKEHHAKDACLLCYKKKLWKPKKIICKNCGKEKYHKAFGLCELCHSKLHHYDKIKAHNYKKWHNISLDLYRQITQKCLVCNFDKVVDLHHLDENHDNNSEDNLIGLCPNHHRMLHNSKYSVEIKQKINEELKKIKSPLDNL
ncbi:MAG: hypothetical protein KAT77_05915 [Nanoarchaeota archaeon]|nr:hypothetical protein [Nanoarchaeota archaeon]